MDRSRFARIHPKRKIIDPALMAVPQGESLRACCDRIVRQQRTSIAFRSRCFQPGELFHEKRQGRANHSPFPLTLCEHLDRDPSSGKPNGHSVAVSHNVTRPQRRNKGMAPGIRIACPFRSGQTNEHTDLEAASRIISAGTRHPPSANLPAARGTCPATIVLQPPGRMRREVLDQFRPPAVSQPRKRRKIDLNGALDPPRRNGRTQNALRERIVAALLQ